MKQKFYLFAALLAMATAASAQIQTEGKRLNGSFRGMPREFSHDNNAYLLSSSEEKYGEENEKRIFTIYNGEIEKVRSIEIPTLTYERRTERQERENIPIVVSERRDSIEVRIYNDDDYWGYHYTYTCTWEEAQTYVEEYSNRFRDGKTDGYRMYSSSTSDYYHYDYDFPTCYYEWNPNDKHLYEVNVSYKDSYTGEWKVTNSYTSTNSTSYGYLYYSNYDDDSWPDNSVTLTQTLFNTDDKFEYLRREYDENVVTIEDEYDDDGDGEIDRRTFVYGAFTGFSIVQEDGTVLQTINSIDTYGEYDLLKFNGKYYLVVGERDENDDYRDVLYLIDSKANAIKRMDIEMPMSVRPSVTDRNGQVTVELGEQSDAKEIWVVNGAGQTVKRIPVEKGQKQVVFSANGLNKGVNVVHASGRNAQASRKIVVK